jgi:hypothetical protein
MPNYLSILPDEARTRVFLCPACSETIALGCERCRFCSIVIDPHAAFAAADLMDRVNLACSEAEDIRALLPWNHADSGIFVPSRSRGDLYFLFLPILIARWWLCYGSVRMDDEDSIKARHDLKQYALFTVGGIALVALLALSRLLIR